MNDSQKQAWQITINNPSTNGWSHETIKATLINNFPTLKYFCMADEVGAEGTPHTHLYVYFSSRVRFSTIKRRFPGTHIESARASVQANIDYIKKTGKWAETEKAETSIEGTFFQWGDIPTQKGSIPEMEELFRLIKDGYSTTEILEINNDYILHIDKIDRIRTMLLIEENKNYRRTDLRVIYISGATGTGKTSGVLDKHGDSNVYRVSDYNHPFDSYNYQPVIAFDEFRSGLNISAILNYLDIYPIELPARYANKYACYHTAYIISNWALEDQYSDIQRLNPSSWKAFLRRIHEVHLYNADGTINKYDSVSSYLNRDLLPTQIAISGFIKNDSEDIPF